MNNRTLLIVFISVLLIFLAARGMRNRTTSSGPRLTGIDTPRVGVIDRKRSLDQIRDSSLVNMDVNDMTKLEWSNTIGRKEVLSKEDGIWHYAGMEALDSLSVHAYLQQLSNLHGTEFSELTSVPEKRETEKLIIYGNNMIDPVTVAAYDYMNSVSRFLIHSSQNKDAIFLSDSAGIYKKIFGDLRQFWPDGE